jgi:hypothetical protein
LDSQLTWRWARAQFWFEQSQSSFDQLSGDSSLLEEAEETVIWEGSDALPPVSIILVCADFPSKEVWQGSPRLGRPQQLELLLGITAKLRKSGEITLFF